MSAAELKISLFRELDKLGQDELKEAYQVLMDWLKKHDKPQPKAERQIGSMKGILTYMADDFDAPLDDFKDYMP